MTKPVTAIIVTYQSARTIGAALAAARRCHDAGLLDLVVVDNASRDATPQILAGEAGWGRVVLESTNHGFGRGSNIGLALVKSPYTLFLNPDAAIEPPALATMLEFMERRPGAGIVGPATLCGSKDPQPQPTGPYPTPWSLVREAAPFLRRRSSAVPIVPGAAPMRTGWVCGAAVARHVVGASSGGGPRVGTAVAKHYYQSRYYYMAKHHGWLAATAAEVGEFVLLSLESALDALRGRGLQRLQPRLQAALLSLPDER